MPLETTELRQKAVLWPASGIDRAGHHKRGSAEEICVRWQYSNTEATDRQGNRIAIDATVVVDRAVSVGSILWLGSLLEHNAAASPGDYCRVVSFSTIPDIKNQNTRRVLYLQRLGDTLPMAN